MKLSRFHLRLSASTGWRVQWKIDGINLTDTIELYRGSSPEGPWELVTTLLSNFEFFDDEVPSFRGFFSHIYYKIIVKNILEETILESKGVTSEYSGNRMVNEITRQHDLLLYGTNGHPGYFSRGFACYKRTRFGTPCHYCLNEHTGEVMLDQCQQCGGSRSLEGWSNPAIFRGRWIGPLSKQTQVTPTTESETNFKQLFMSNYPIIDSSDVLIEEGTGASWQIMGMTTTMPGGYLCSQNLSLSQIDPQHIQAKLVFPSE